MANAGIWLEKLQESGYRLMAPYRAVVQVLAENDLHAEPHPKSSPRPAAFHPASV